MFTCLCAENSIQQIKSILASDKILVMPDCKKPLVLYVDCSDYAVGCALMKKGPTGIHQPVHYFSKKLRDTHNRPAQRKLCMSEKEVKHENVLGVYLSGSIVVFTDHFSSLT